ncbi:HNH endonuclease [Pseudarthrobacter oxydans]|uniref:HNH endonuclease n=1 Tax=Pseudarthrobacter oxydans TaxID=1671 RepID=UPI00342A5DCF
MRTGSLETTRFIKHPCAIDGCKNELASKRGWCATHYSRWRKTGSTGPAAVKVWKAPIVDGMKDCGDCGEMLPLASYNANSHGAGLPKSMCRACERSRNVAWREANPTYWQQWQKDNVQKTRDISNRRRAHKLSREHEKIDRDLVFERDGYECKLCMHPLDMDAKFPHPWSPTLDHIQPLSKGGHHLYVNLQAAHFHCNTAKGDRVDPEAFAYLLQES